MTRPGAVTRRDTHYVLETEKGVEGHYYFPFRNILDGPAELEFQRADCDCSEADACLLPLEAWQKIDSLLAETPWAQPTVSPDVTWYKFTKNEHTGLKIPTGGQGLLRISWKGRKDPGEMLKLALYFWSQPDGVSLGRQITPIFIPVKMCAPILFDPPEQSVGLLGPGATKTVEFYVWSPTREQPDLAFGLGDKQDPLLEISAQPLTKPECEALRERLILRDQAKGDKAKGLIFRVKSGYLVTVKLREQVGARQMDQGPFLRHIPITLDGEPPPYGTPQITGAVKGIVDVGGEVDQARVQFKTFSAADAKTVSVPLYGDPQLTLSIDHVFPKEWLTVDLKRNSKHSTAARAQWDLKVTIPAGAWRGPLPEQSCVVLRIAGNPPGLFGFPFVGFATMYPPTPGAERRRVLAHEPPRGLSAAGVGSRTARVDKISQKGDEWAFPAARRRWAACGSSRARTVHDAE